MTTVTVNSVALTKEIKENSTLDDLIENVLAEDSSLAIKSIQVDGKQLSATEEQALLTRPITSYSEIDLHLTSKVEIALESLDSCSSYIDIVLGRIFNVVDLYAQNKNKEANEQFGEVVEIMDLFVQLMVQINNTFRKYSNKKYNKSDNVIALENHLLGILRALIPAKEKDDIIMLCDLLEYELADNLIQWKEKIIPEIKMFQTM